MLNVPEPCEWVSCSVFFFQAEDGIRYWTVTGVQTCALPIFFGGTAGSVCRSGRDEPKILHRYALEECLVLALPQRPQHRHALIAGVPVLAAAYRSEERRVGKEGRSLWSPYH